MRLNYYTLKKLDSILFCDISLQQFQGHNQIALLSGYTAKKNYIFLIGQAMEYCCSSGLSYYNFSKTDHPMTFK